MIYMFLGVPDLSGEKHDIGKIQQKNERGWVIAKCRCLLRGDFYFWKLEGCVALLFCCRDIMIYYDFSIWGHLFALVSRCVWMLL